MASTLSFFRPAMVRASAGPPGKPDPNHRKSVSSNWWAPVFGWPTDPDYMGQPQKADPEPTQPRSKFAPGCFTAEKAKELRRKTMETSSFHDLMYHSAIASRLASDVSMGSEK